MSLLNDNTTSEVLLNVVLEALFDNDEDMLFRSLAHKVAQKLEVLLPGSSV